jgi:transcriptional regulator with XRE-family HTH domain
VLLSERLRELREEKNLSQGDIEKRTGLLRCYISRVENGHTVPEIGTLEKFARAFKVPLYQLFYDWENPSQLPSTSTGKGTDDLAWGASRKQAVYLKKLRNWLSKMNDADRQTLLALVQRLATSRKRRPQTSRA